MYYVYLIKNKLNTKYLGCTGDLKNRMLQHNSGKIQSTKNKSPWKLVYYEAFLNKYDAFNREKELKTEYTKKRHLLNRIQNSLLE